MEIKQNPDSETGIQLLARLRQPPNIEDLEQLLFGKLQPTEVIEVSGESGCGKTELMYHFILKCIMPSKWNNLQLNGLGASVIFIDTDYHFHLSRLITILQNKISQLIEQDKSNAISQNAIHSFIQEQLKSLYVIHCSTSQQLNVTLHSLDLFLVSNSSVSLVIVDSISAFYWLDRMRYLDNFKMLDEHHSQLVAVLHRLINEYRLVLVVTKQILMKSSELNQKQAGSTSDNESSLASYFGADYLGRSWQRFVKTRIVVEKGLKTDKCTQTNIVIHKISSGKRELIPCQIDEKGVKFLQMTEFQVFKL